MTQVPQVSWEPVKIEFSRMSDLKRDHPELKIVDLYEELLEELFLLRNPKYRFDKNYRGVFENFAKEHAVGKMFAEVGNWFYFPWQNAVVHYLEENLHQELRTGRNKNLITGGEQEKYYGAIIAVLGMSVGSHAALTIAMTGGAKRLRLADPDSISGDNLNRIRSGFQNVGLNKAVYVARQVFEINPYAEIECYQEGLTENNLDEILDGVSVVIEEMDNPFFKIKIREEARSRKIPVLMGTDNGDGIIVDIERFDLNKKYPIIHGKIKGITSEKFRQLSPKELPRVAAKIAGADLAVPRMLLSVPEVGKTLYSWPQLGTAANLCGTAIAYLSRRIILGARNIHSGRYEINLDAQFESDYERKWLSRKIGFLKFIWKMSRQK